MLNNKTELLFFKVGVGKIDVPTKFDRCYFCDCYVLSKDISVWNMDSDDVKDTFVKLLGEVPKQGAGSIGKRSICVNCAEDLWNVLELGKFKLEYDYD